MSCVVQNLTELLRGLAFNADVPNLLVNRLSDDSRAIGSETVFFAYPGEKVDGRDFLEEAVAAGATACVVEAQGFVEHDSLSVPMIPVLHLRDKLAEIAARFYQFPSRRPQVAGITGTNGKTSCVHFLAQALQSLNESVAVLSTLGNGVWPGLSPSPLTTLGALELQRQFFSFNRAGVGHVAMEVSSHALMQARVNAVEFDLAVFTSLSHEHLEYHHDMQSYANAKYRLFSMPGLRKGIVNTDDPYGRVLLRRVPHLEWIGYSAEGASYAGIPMVRATQVELSPGGMRMAVSSPWGDFRVELALLGQFNVSNILVVIATLGVMGYSPAQVQSAIAAISTVPGRMETLGGGSLPLVVVDYAHTPDALQQALVSLRPHCVGQLSCVFGCGGGRDVAKRSVMAAVAEEYADRVIVTNDNPRFDVPESITKDIRAGFKAPERVHEILDRKEAISFAVQSAQIGDIVLLAGKGHESVQIIGNQQFEHDDRVFASAILDSVIRN